MWVKVRRGERVKKGQMDVAQKDDERERERRVKRERARPKLASRR